MTILCGGFFLFISLRSCLDIPLNSSSFLSPVFYSSAPLFVTICSSSSLNLFCLLAPQPPSSSSAYLTWRNNSVSNSRARKPQANHRGSITSSEKVNQDDQMIGLGTSSRRFEMCGHQGSQGKHKTRLHQWNYL